MGGLIVQRGLYEAPDEMEREWEQCFVKLRPYVAEQREGEREAQARRLQELSSSSREHSGEVTKALLYGMLTDARAASKYLAVLTSVTRDGFQLCCWLLNKAVMKWSRLAEGIHMQIVLLARELLKAHATDVEGIYLLLLRHVPVGEAGLPLAAALLDALQENMQWLQGRQLLPVACYAFLRLLASHVRRGETSATYNEVVRKEVTFVCHLMEQHRAECLAVGRDLVRALHEAARVPEIEALWTSLFQQEEILHELLSRPTPRVFLLSRLTPEMESYLYFLMSQVRFGCQNRYQRWFQQKYLGPHSEAMVQDLIRYCVGVYHPSNAILSSNIVPRWAVVGWLLSVCHNPCHLAACRLALYFDWLFYQPVRDSIMNVEPGLLVMTNSLPKYADMTASLMEFVLLLRREYFPTKLGRELVGQGIRSALSIMLQKGVIRSLSTLVHNSLIAEPLRARFEGLLTGEVDDDNDSAVGVNDTDSAPLQKGPEWRSRLPELETAARTGEALQLSTATVQLLEAVDAFVVDSDNQEVALRTVQEVAAALDKLAQGSVGESGAVVHPGGSLFTQVSVPMLQRMRAMLDETGAQDEESEADATARVLFQDAEEPLSYVGSALLDLVMTRGAQQYDALNGSSGAEWWAFQLLYELEVHHSYPVGAAFLCYVALARKLQDGPGAELDEAAGPKLYRLYLSAVASREAAASHRGGSSSSSSGNSNKRKRAGEEDPGSDGHAEPHGANTGGPELGKSSDRSQAQLLHLLHAHVQVSITWCPGVMQWLAPTIYQKSTFSDVTGGDVSLLELLTACSHPQAINELANQIVCGEATVFGSIGAAVTAAEAARKWDYWQQHATWRLIQAEASWMDQASSELERLWAAPGLAVQLLRSVRRCALASEAQEDALAIAGTLEGLVGLVGGTTPSAAVVSALLALPLPTCMGVSEEVLITWAQRSKQFIRTSDGDGNNSSNAWAELEHALGASIGGERRTAKGRVNPSVAIVGELSDMERAEVAGSAQRVARKLQAHAEPAVQTVGRLLAASPFATAVK